MCHCRIVCEVKGNNGATVALGRYDDTAIDPADADALSCQVQFAYALRYVIIFQANKVTGLYIRN